MKTTWDDLLKLYPFLEGFSKTHPSIKKNIINRVNEEDKNNPGDPSLSVQLDTRQAIENLGDKLDKVMKKGFKSIGKSINRSNIYSGLFAGKLLNPNLTRKQLSIAWEFAKENVKDFN